MTTLYISIGNSDNKLTQEEWADYCSELKWVAEGAISVEKIYGIWYSASDSKHQNMCVALECSNDIVLKKILSKLCKTFRQDSIAVAYATTAFVTPTSEEDSNEET